MTGFLVDWLKNVGDIAIFLGLVSLGSTMLFRALKGKRPI